MAIITSTSFPDLTANLEVFWRDGYERVKKNAVQLFSVSFNQKEVTDSSTLEWAAFARRKDQGDTYFESSPTQGYRKTMTKYRIGYKAQITWEMRTYDKYNEMKKAIMKLGELVAQRMELDLTHRFTFGTAATYTDQDGQSVSITSGDSLSLFNTAHTVRGSSTTFRNRVANNPEFSRAGLEAAELLGAVQMISQDGNKIVVDYDTIAFANNPSLENKVLEFLNSTASPSYSNSGVTNVYKSKYKPLMLPYLATTAAGARDSTKENYWFLAAAAHSDALLEISEMPHMVAPTPGSNGEDFDTDNWNYKASSAYGIEILDPRCFVFSSGDAVA